MDYRIKPKLKPDERAKLDQYSDFLAHMLFHRGVRTNETASEFLNPDYELHTHDPFLMKDAEKAARRIIQAIKNNEKIAIYADYDADGIPGAALFSDFMDRIGYTNFTVYIPHRHNEGFGINMKAVGELISGGAKLIVSIDCGVTDVLPVNLAADKGVDVIITDHHEPPEVLPRAFAIVDHRQKDCAYPDKNLCGSAVAFKLIQAILKVDRMGLPEGNEKWLLDMVGIATLSDMVPLIGENRVLAAFGMAVLKKSRRKGLVKLFSELGMRQQHLTEDDIAFMVTPRINAASRMGVPMDAFHLLCAKTEEDAQKCFDHLDHINNQRKGIVASLVKEIKKTITDRYGKEIPEAIVLGNPEWRPSLLGLAANTCAGEFHRPVFLWGRDGDGGIKGSCRSEGQSSVVKIMRAVEPGILGQFGGHYHSGGFAVSDEGVYFLEQKIVEACQSLRNKTLSENEGAGMTDDDGTRDEFIDQEITIDDVDRRLENEIVKLSPFGKDNPRPLFLFRRIAPSAVRVFGKAKEHIELIFERGNRPPVGAVKFFASENEWANKISAGSKIDLVASIEKSYFRGREDIRLRIEDVNIILF